MTKQQGFINRKIIIKNALKPFIYAGFRAFFLEAPPGFEPGHRGFADPVS